LARVVGLIRSEPATPLLLTDSADSICGACPHLTPSGCGRDRRGFPIARDRDEAVFRRTGLRPGMKVSAAEAYARVRDNLDGTIMAQEICAGCEWEEYGYCAEGLRKLSAFNGDGDPRPPCGEGEQC